MPAELKLPSDQRKWSRTESTLAEAEVEEVTEGHTFKAVRRGTGRLVRVEEVHHYRQKLLVGMRSADGDVTLAQTFHRLDRQGPEHPGVMIRMSAAEARRIGQLLIEAATEAGPDQSASEGDASPKTSAMTSLAPASADEIASSTSNDRVSNVDFSTCRRTAFLVFVLSSSSAVLLRCISRSVLRIASTARCWPRARNAGSNSSIYSSMVTRKSHGSRPGEAVELHAPNLAGAWPVAPTEGAAA